MKIVEVDALNAWIAANQRDEVVPSPLPTLDPQPNAPDAEGWKLTFADEFDNLSISTSLIYDGSRWYAETEPSNMPHDATHKVWPHVIAPTTVEQANPFSIVDGALRIRLTKVNGVWYGGSIATADPYDNKLGFAQDPPCFWEAKMKLPPGLGPWLSFWCKSQKRMGPPGPNGMYTQCGENDILEYWGGAPAFWTNLHDWTQAPSGVGGNKAMGRSDFYSDFHTYGMDWDATRMLIYFDGNQVGNIPTPDVMKALTYYPILTMGMGGGYAYDKTPDPSDLFVDYVRVWSK